MHSIFLVTVTITSWYVYENTSDLHVCEDWRLSQVLPNDTFTQFDGDKKNMIILAGV